MIVIVFAIPIIISSRPLICFAVGSNVIDSVPIVKIPVTLASPSTNKVVFPAPTCTVPTPVLIVDIPTTFIPFAKTSIPVLAVTIPRESTFSTSSYVIVPPTVTFPENSADAAVIIPTVMLGVPVSP